MINKPLAEIEEISSVLTPANGVTLDQAVSDAQLAGFELLSLDRDNNCATISWFKKGLA